MDKNVKPKNEIRCNSKMSLEFRFITVTSLDTEESLNIGIIIEEYNSSPRIITIPNINFMNSLFPIFDKEHFDFCLQSIEIKYKLKKVKNERFNISKVVSVSSPRLYNLDYNELNLIDEILLDKFITYRKFEKSLFLKIKDFHELFLKKMKKKEKEKIMISLEYDTNFLFHDNDNKFKLLKEKLK